MSNKTLTLMIVGTDTNVGKTVFSGLFGRYLISNDINLQILKPFCSGSTNDIDFLLAECEIKRKPPSLS